MHTSFDRLSDGNETDWHTIINGNIKGLQYVSQPIIREMKTKNKRHIINISLVAARQTYANGTVYCATKKAVDTISEAMRIELTEFGIKVNQIQPRIRKTDFSMVRFKGNKHKANAVYADYEPLISEDIANAIAYCLNVPDGVSVAEICIYPKAQAKPRTLYRK